MVGDYPEWQALVITVVCGVVGALIRAHPTSGNVGARASPSFGPRTRRSSRRLTSPTSTLASSCAVL